MSQPGNSRSAIMSPVYDVKELGTKCVNTLLGKETDTCPNTIWTHVKTSDGISVYRGIVEGSEWNAVKAKGRIHCSAAFLADKLQDAAEMTTFDEMTAKCTVIETLDRVTKTSIRYVQAKPVFPTTARDFLVVTTEKRLNDGTIAIASKSIEHPSVPESKHFVRGHTHISGYVLHPISDNECELTLIVHMDLGGMLPAVVINMLAVDSPLKLLKRFRQLYGNRNQPSKSLPSGVNGESSAVTVAKQKYMEHGAESIRLIMEHESGIAATWTEVKVVDGITVFRGIVKGSEWNAVKAKGIIQSNARYLANKLQDPIEMTTFDEMTARCHVIQDIDTLSKTSIRHVHAKPVFPTTARDFVVVTSEMQLKDGTIVIASRSIDHPNAPVSKHYVRANTHISGYVLRPISQEECEITLIVHMDLGGMIPAVVINVLAVDSPIKLLKRFRQLYGSHGNSRRRMTLTHRRSRSISPSATKSISPESQKYLEDGQESIDSLLEKAQENSNDTTWTQVKTTDGITVYRGIVAGSEWNAVKATGIIRCPSTHLADILQDINQMTIYDEMTAMCRIIDQIDVATKTTVRYAQAKPVFPTTARDFVVVTAEKRYQDGRIAIASKSVKHPAVPEDKNFVRAHTHISGYLIEPIDSMECQVTLIVHMDLQGMLPAVVINILAVDSPIKLLKRFRSLYENSTRKNQSYGSVTSSGSSLEEEQKIIKRRQHLGPQALRDIHIAEKSEYDHKKKDSRCHICDKIPSFLHRHNCRVCGHIVCGECSTHRIHTTTWRTIRACDKCVEEIHAKEHQALSPKETIPIVEKVDEILAVNSTTWSVTRGLIISGMFLIAAIWSNNNIVMALTLFVLFPIGIGYLLQTEDDLM